MKENIPFQPNNNLEYFKQRKNKREGLKDYLPPSLQMEGTIKPTRWNFDDQLLKRRNSDEEINRIFFEILYLKGKKEISEEDQEKLSRLEQKSFQSKKEIGELFKISNYYENGLEQHALKEQWSDYASLLQSAVEMNIIKNKQE